MKSLGYFKGLEGDVICLLKLYDEGSSMGRIVRFSAENTLLHHGGFYADVYELAHLHKEVLKELSAREAEGHIREFIRRLDALLRGKDEERF